jgi:diadenosine tetraphosphate (Ap4A) HIT family hydrolase
MSVSDCALCAPSAHEVLWANEVCRVVLLNDDDYPAYCRVEWLAHVKEMTDLAIAERLWLMQVVFAVESALRQVCRPEKINLASLGNKTPHLHWHVIPRFETDRHFPNSHWAEPVRDAKSLALTPDNIKALAVIIAAQLPTALD